MKRTLLLTLVCGLSLAALAATPPSAAKKTTGLKPAPDGSRFLLVVDNSVSMKPIDPATRRIVFDLIFTGVEGYMRTGDTMGMWTFNDEIGAGKFPMQVWDGQNPVDTASRAAMFVRDQEYKGDNSVEELMIQLAAVMRAAKDVNIFIFSDGDTPMQGTPFDREINGAYSKRGKERKTARKPFMTTLVVRGGLVASAFVVLGGESIQLPERPAPTPTVARPTAPAATNSSAARPIATPAAGKPRASAASPETDAASPEQSASKTNPNAVESPVIATIPRAVPPAPEPREPNLDQPKVPPVESASTVAVAGPVDTQSELPSASDDPKPAPAPRKKVMQIITLPSAPAPTNEQAAKTPASAETNAPPAAALAITPVPALPTPPAPPPSTTAVPLTPPTPNPDTAKPSPSTPAEGASTVKPLVAATVTQTAGSNQLSALLLPAPIVAAAREPASLPPATTPPTTTPSTTPALAAMQVHAPPGLGAMPALIFGGIMLALSLFLLGVALRRFRPESQGSLITQSMHRR